LDTIKRISFGNPKKDIIDFEIVTLKEFLSTRSWDHLTRVYRLDFYIMIFITSGKGSHEIDFKVHSFESGDVILISKDQVHRFISMSEASGYIILFTEEYLLNHYEKSRSDFLGYFTNPIISIDESKLETSIGLMNILYKEYSMEDSVDDTQLIKSLFRSFILSLRKNKELDIKRETTTFSTRFVEFKNLVEQYYKEKKTVVEYAELMLVSQKTINQITRRAVDLSAKQFIIDRIILESKRYLAQGELTINEISYMLGFDEPSNFTKFFKRYEGISPNQFKKKYFNS